MSKKDNWYNLQYTQIGLTIGAIYVMLYDNSSMGIVWGLIIGQIIDIIIYSMKKNRLENKIKNRGF